MKRNLISIMAVVLALIVTSAALADKSVELRQRDGTRWRGQINDMITLTFEENRVPIELKGRLVEVTDLFVIVEGAIAGEIKKKYVFRNDIISVANAAPGASADRDRRREAADAGKGSQPAADSGKQRLGVFVLPLDGMVGLEFRAHEIEALASHCDQYGPGQIIVLVINSGGGNVEMERIHTTLMEVKKRHRVIAWVKSAISAACAVALNCDEIYFMTEGRAGAMTGYSGGVAMKGAQLEFWLKLASEWAEVGGRNGQIARAMIYAPVELSYDKNEETGEITWHNDLSGKYVLSDEKDNLVFNASNAMHCGFADGIADTEEELAKLLDLPRWHEIDDYGRRIHDDWTRTVEQGKERIPLLMQRLSYAGAAGDALEQLGKRIQIYQELIQWVDRTGDAAPLLQLPPREWLEQQIKDLRYQIAQIRKAQR